MDKKRIEDRLAPLEEEALADLARLVDTNSFTGNVNGVNAVAGLIVDMARKNGLNLERVPAGGNSAGAHHLIAADTGDAPAYGIIGHFDTVHPPESSFDRLIDRGDTLTGPGVQDMKSGIVAAIYGLRVAREVTGIDALPVRIVFNCDEETGSVDSRPLIERVMQGVRGAFIFEGHSASDYCLVTRRKGIIMGHMQVAGRAAHAGEAPAQGASAIVEAAHKITALDALTDLDSGRVVTTGKIKGGEVANQIPDHCRSTIDVRFRTPADEMALKAAIGDIMTRTHIPGCTTDYQLTTVRPPFLKTEESEILRRQYEHVAAEFGIKLGEKEGGGGSDGNLTAAMGIATIDGVGPAGDFAHTDNEYIQKASFFDAVKIFALLLTQLLQT